MHQAPYEERLDYYRYANAAQSFQQVRQILEELIDPKLGTQCWLVLALWTAFFTEYGKPFKQKQDDKATGRGLRLPPDIVPPEYRNQHNAIMTLRDKMFAHTDFASFTDSGSRPLHAAIIHVEKRVPRNATKFILPRTTEARVYVQLVDELMKKVSYRAGKIWKRWLRHINIPDNSTWKINVGTDSNDVLIMEPWEAEWSNR